MHTMETSMLLLLVLGLMVSCSSQVAPVNRCDVVSPVSVTTPCTSCAASTGVSCPRGLRKVTKDMGTPNCRYVVVIGGVSLMASGCSHTCEKTVTRPRCCPDHFGPQCTACPTWSGKTCNWHGTCMDGMAGNGTCVCEAGFSGFACQECQEKNVYGDRCTSVCSCVHGECNAGPEGNGECYCQPPYTGPKCDQVTAACKDCTAYSHCKGVADSAVCECLPRFKKVGLNCAGVCTAETCHVDADCSYLGGRTFQCKCKDGYEGDGQMCVPINPCVQHNVCPANSTVCVYSGPGKAACACMSGMEGSNPAAGCSLRSACSDSTCDRTARCETEMNGTPRCLCHDGQIGDGRRCYGNLMERVVELDREGSQKGKLSGTIMLFEKGCQDSLSQPELYTVFLPLLKTPLSGDLDVSACKLHLIHGQHLYKDLEGKDFSTVLGAEVRFKGNKKFILMDAPKEFYTIIQEDIPAANGIIHIIDMPMKRNVPDTTRDEQFADKTIGEIITKDEKYNRFLSLVDNCGAAMPLRGPGPLTVFIPTNQAVDDFRDGSVLYMLTDAKHKLQELLKHHMYSYAALTVDQLASVAHILSMANQIIGINVTSDGRVALGEKSYLLETTNIIASNGIIHMISGVLVPPSIVPILPHRCDVTESKITVGPCVKCSYLFNTDCPPGSTELQTHLTGCDYLTSPREPFLNKGCAKYCNSSAVRADCCPGFYGPDCKPCIGGFQHPCYDKGACFEGIHGNGSCQCNVGFKGIACHICSNTSTHGENCNEVCRCLHGVCDNRPGSLGVCRRGTCQEGFSGDYCDKEAKQCNSDGLSEHCHIHAFCNIIDSEPTCACMPGYEGDGHYCTEVNPCLLPDKGGCDSNAQCVYAGPGSMSCVCNEGWAGDGLACSEVNPCQLEGRGGCHEKADCKYIGPGASDCTCKRNYMGDGFICDIVNPCLIKNGGCHALAKCEKKDNGTHSCDCPEGYAGDGVSCYGTIQDELEMNPDLYLYNRFIQRSSNFDLSGNITALVPSREAMRNLSRVETDFWLERYHLPYLLKVHFLQGIYSVEDLDKHVNKKLQTLNSATAWEVKNISGVVMIENATILTPNIPALNGYIHIIDTVLTPPLSDVPPVPPSLMECLNKTPNFSLFREAALLYNLTDTIGTNRYTILLPHDDAIREHLSTSNSTVLDVDVFKYHVILHEEIFPDHLMDGTLKTTVLGSSYQIMFHLNSKNETSANDVPLDGNYTETQEGVIMVLPKVLQVHKNRCSNEILFRVRGRCGACDEAPKCLYIYKPLRSEFPRDMRSNCKYRKRVGSRRKSVDGCVIDCLKTTKDHACCPGYHGHDCFKCPGELDNWCYGNGKCQDGNLGSGECLCNEGFHGTACETCEPGRYGKDCLSACSCSHGRCLDGLGGSGTCLCYKGWKGDNCSVEIKNDACGGVCDDNANCVSEGAGSAPVCSCVAGYQGNGTVCKERDLCTSQNGGCSEFANCTKTSPGERSCTCREGYTGDGVVCLEIDSCLKDNGGCDPNAECVKTGPSRVACICSVGYSGSGRFCYPLNPCRIGNGGCGRFARCRYLGRGERNCTCLSGHVGDGFDCRGSTRAELYRQTSQFSIMLSRSGVRNMNSRGPFTLFLPQAENYSFAVDPWVTLDRDADLVRYHIVQCETLMMSDLRTTAKAVAISGHTLYFDARNGSVYINGDAKIVKSDYITSDGVIHYIDKVLTPYDLKDKSDLSITRNFTTAAKAYGYRRFSELVQKANLLGLLEDSIHQPFTMFWVSDQALSSLSPDRARWLYSEDHRDKLAAYIKAHIIRNVKITSTMSQQSYRTMHGSMLSCACDKTVVGDIIVNDDNAKIIERYMLFENGVAYGIDQLLEPPGLGAHCDGLQNRTTYGNCGSCPSPGSCPISSVYTGKTEPCSYRPFPHYGRRHSLFSDDLDLGNLGFYRTFRKRPGNSFGCKRVCTSTAWVPKCCKNHYGRDCQACPGGVEAPCGNRARCDDGRMGSGTCECLEGFLGTACELCEPQRYGPNCTVCNCTAQGKCDDGMDREGLCLCREGWMGDRCQIQIEKTPVCSPGCHANALCLPDNLCQCEPQYEGDGRNCTAPDLCSEYNGGCHQHAVCSQTGVSINCTCLSGYVGDGYACSPINRCVEEANGGCSDFATCAFTGPNERQCECMIGYVGQGIQCLEKVVPPIDRCQEGNGGCDPKAICKDLHFHGNTAGVFHLRSSAGKYKMNYTTAEASCQNEEAALATFPQMSDAQQLGMHLCVAGWIDGQKVGYPITSPSVKCGDNHVGIVLYKEPLDTSSLYDAYCYRVKDVSCECGSGYVGDGDFCNGDMASVVATNSNYSVFYNALLKYANTSPEGRNLLDFFLTKSSYATLFVPHNAGFSVNETLSGRDVEYHISNNNSLHFYDDLKHNSVILSRLGLNISVAINTTQQTQDPQTRKLVNQRMLLAWDIPAVNGIIHIIEGPFRAPPLPVHHHGKPSGHSAATSILVTLGIMCVVTGLAYYVFKHKNDAFRFHYFRNEDEDVSSRGGGKPALVSIPNPLYSGHRAFAEPFGDSGQEAEPSEPPQPQPPQSQPQLVNLLD